MSLLSAQQILSLGRDGPDIGLAGYLSSMLDRPHTGSKKSGYPGTKCIISTPYTKDVHCTKAFFKENMVFK